MAEQPVEAVTEELRREAVKAIANAGTQAQTAVRSTGAGLANAGRSVLADQGRDAARYGVPGLQAELSAMIQPALAGNATWAREAGAFERRDTANRQTAAGDFFAGVRSATPIVQSQADASRAASEAESLNAVLQQELQIGSQALGFRQAVEQRQAAREAASFQRQQAEQQQAFQRQAQAENIALQRAALAFQEREAARMAAALTQQQQPPATGRPLTMAERGFRGIGKPWQR